MNGVLFLCFCVSLLFVFFLGVAVLQPNTLHVVFQQHTFMVMKSLADLIFSTRYIFAGFQ